MKRNLITLIIFTLVMIPATRLPAFTQRLVDVDTSPIGQPILLASDDGSHFYTVNGHWDNPGWGFALHVSSDGGWTWSKTYENYQGQDHFNFDADFGAGTVYVARIDSWNVGASDYYELSVQRFDADGNRDTSFANTGMLSVSGQTTDVISDVSLIAEDDMLQIFWISNDQLKHSSCRYDGIFLGHTNIGSTTAYGSLDAVRMAGDNTDFFLAFKGSGNELKGWRWTENVGLGLVDITPDTDLYPEWEDVTVSAYGRRVEVVVGSPYNSNPTEVHELSSDDDALSWTQNVLATGWDSVGLQMVSPSVVIGPGQTVSTFLFKDDNENTSEWAWLQRSHGENWTSSGHIFTSDTDFIGRSMGLCRSADGGYLGLFYSNNPLASQIIFVKLPQLMRSSFDEGDFSGWSGVVGN